MGMRLGREREKSDTENRASNGECWDGIADRSSKNRPRAIPGLGVSGHGQTF